MSTLKCPMCSSPLSDKTFLPFCSNRCKQVDLGKWLTDSYTIPTQESVEESSSTPDEES